MPFVITCTGLSIRQVDEVQQFLKRFGMPGSEVCPSWNESVTHVIAKSDEMNVADRTLKFLHGIANNLWIVSFEWVKSSLQESKLLDEVNLKMFVIVSSF